MSKAAIAAAVEVLARVLTTKDIRLVAKAFGAIAGLDVGKSGAQVKERLLREFDRKLVSLESQGPERKA